MSFLSSIHLYWASNATLNNALPATSVYTGLSPEGSPFPRAVIVPVATTATYTTGKGYISNLTFQISVFDTNPDNVEALCQTILDQFNWKTIDGLTMACVASGEALFMVDPDTAERTYHGVLTFDMTENRTLP